MYERDRERLWREMVRRSWSPRQWFEDGAAPDTSSEGEDALMWVYRQYAASTRYEVGYYDPHKNWIQDSVHATREEAAARVHYLNGG